MPGMMPSLLGAIAASSQLRVVPSSQPGALDLYPPTRQGRFSVRLDHFRFSRPVRRFGLRYAAYEQFATNRSGPVLFYVRA